MRRIVTVGALVAIVLMARARGPRLQQRLMAHCEGMFDRMPDTFPPKRMLTGIEEIRATTARILTLLEARAENAGESETEVAHHAA